MKKPDFILVGESRCGSTSLYETLIQHPDIILPKADFRSKFKYGGSKIDISQKELRFFDRQYAKGEEWYFNRFVDETGTIIGDASATYLYAPFAIERIKKSTPHSKILILLRNPIDRTISHYYHMCKINEGFASMHPNFEDFFRSNLVKKPHHHIIERGFYHITVKRCLEHFPNAMIIKSEDLFSNDETLNKIQEFLEIPNHPLKLEHFRSSKPNPINDKLRELMREFFRPHNEKLYDLVGRDYGWQ